MFEKDVAILRIESGNNLSHRKGKPDQSVQEGDELLRRCVTIREIIAESHFAENRGDTSTLSAL